MDSSSSLIGISVCNLLNSDNPEKRRVAFEAIEGIETTIRRLKPVLKHVVIPVTVSPYGRSSGPQTWFGAENPNRPIRATEIALAPLGKVLLIDEKGKFIVATRCGNPNEYHGTRETNYGKRRRYSWHDFPLDQVVGGLLEVFERARSRREKYLESIKEGEVLLHNLRSRILVN